MHEINVTYLPQWAEDSRKPLLTGLQAPGTDEEGQDRSPEAMAAAASAAGVTLCADKMSVESLVCISVTLEAQCLWYNGSFLLLS